MRLEVTHQTDLQEWDALIGRFSGSIFLRPECLTLEGDGSSPRFFRFYDDQQKLIGIALGAIFHARRKILGRLIRSLYLPTLPVTDQKFPGYLDQMIEKVTEYGRRVKVISITIGSFYSSVAYEGFEQIGYETRPRWEFLLDLQSPEDQIWDRLDAHHRRYIRYGEKRGLCFVEDKTSEGLDCLMALQENATKRIRTRGGDDSSSTIQEYRMIKESIVDKGLGYVFLAMRDGQAHSGLLIAVHQRKAYLIFSGTSPEGYKLRASVFLYWNTALALKKMGILEWNLGGTPWEAQDETSDAHGLYMFKGRFGTKRILCYSAEMHRVNKLRAATVRFARVLKAWNR